MTKEERLQQLIDLREDYEWKISAYEEKIDDLENKIANINQRIESMGE